MSDTSPSKSIWQWPEDFLQWPPEKQDAWLREAHGEKLEGIGRKLGLPKDIIWFVSGPVEHVYGDGVTVPVGDKIRIGYFLRCSVCGKAIGHDDRWWPASADIGPRHVNCEAAAGGAGNSPNLDSGLRGNDGGE